MAGQDNTDLYAGLLRERGPMGQIMREPGTLPRAQKVWSHIIGITSAPETNVWYSHTESSSDKVDQVKGETAGSHFDYISRCTCIYSFQLQLTRPYMFLLLGVMIKVKDNLSPFNIKLKNCCSLSASQNKSMRLGNKSQWNLPWSVTLLSGFTRFSNFSNIYCTSTTQTL